MFTFSVLYHFLQVLFKKMAAILMLLVNLTVVYSQRLEASGFPVLPYKAVLHSLFFFFFYFKSFVKPLFIQLFCNNIFTFSVLFFF